MGSGDERWWPPLYTLDYTDHVYTNHVYLHPRLRANARSAAASVRGQMGRPWERTAQSVTGPVSLNGTTDHLFAEDVAVPHPPARALARPVSSVAVTDDRSPSLNQPNPRNSSAAQRPPSPRRYLISVRSVAQIYPGPLRKHQPRKASRPAGFAVTGSGVEAMTLGRDWATSARPCPRSPLSPSSARRLVPPGSTSGNTSSAPSRCCTDGRTPRWTPSPRA